MPVEAWILAFGSAWLFGQGLVLTQFALKHTTPALGAAISMPTAALVFWLSAPFLATFEGWDSDAALLFLVIGIFFPGAITLLTFEANRLMGPYVSGALGNLAPLFAVVAAVLVLGETLDGLQAAAIAIIVLGVSGLSLRRDWNDGVWRHWAMMLPLGAAFLRGVGPPLLKIGLAWWPNPFVAVMLCYLASATVGITVGLLRTRGRERRVTRMGVFWYASVGLSNGFAVMFWIMALALGPVSLISPVVACYPVVTLLLGAIFLRRAQIGVQHVAGVALTVLGVVLLVTA
ncbi:MAG: DMT family transporter [Rhodospirillaceae bacterium]